MQSKDVVDAKTGHAALLALGAIAAGVQENPQPEGQPFVVVVKPDGSTAVEYLERPEQPIRPTGSIATYDVASFCLAVNRYRSTASMVYAKLRPASLVCVLNDHALENDGAAGWRDHRVLFALEHSPEYLAWSAQDKKPMDQRAFIEFIEDQLQDFSTPSGAKMYEIATNFKAKSSASFKSNVSQSNGALHLEYVEQVEGGAGRTGAIDIPEEFKITVPVWSGLEQKKYAFNARFRYRVAGGQLTFLYALERPVKVVEQAFADTLEEIKKRVKDVAIVFGAP